MKKGDRIEINGRLVEIDAVLGGNSFSYHAVKEEDIPVLEEIPVVGKKPRKRKKA
jgi:hypothetical protein